MDKKQSQYCAVAVRKTNSFLGCNRKGIGSRSYSALVRPCMDYSPYMLETREKWTYWSRSSKGLQDDEGL